MIVVDANILIAHLDANDIHHDRAMALLLDLADSPLAASPLTLAEVLVGPARSGQLARANTALALLEVASIDLGPDAPMQLALLRAGTSLKLPDCCVLLAAENSTAAIATFDHRLAEVARDRGFEVHN
ncbi:MAG: type II toxin-antitoxin system VapC family toxin [Acidimicrobiales bacterium]